MVFHRLSEMKEAIKSEDVLIPWVMFRSYVKHALEDGCITQSEHSDLLSNIGGDFYGK